MAAVVEEAPKKMAPATSSAREDWPFDGRQNGYFPQEPIQIDPSCRLRTDAETSVDPINFEVIRSHLWNINLEHGETIKRVSGSPIVIFANDFNQSIHIENGDPVAFGPTILHFTGLADLAIKWTLENRSANPGIHEGDIFLHNDPWVGSSHQMDCTVYAPVFQDGRVFCWVLNVCHMRDVGGNEPGSWVLSAKDVFAESQPIPPMKIAINDVLLRDFEEMFTRKSRMAELCALELRSQVAGVLSAKKRVLALVARYGAPVVKGVMQKMISDCERAVRARLARLPDGVWRSEVYFGSVNPGDRTLGKQVLEMTKEGEQLSFSNAGTAPQGGATNCTASAWRASIFVGATAMLAYDQYFCAAGVLRCLKFEPTPGLRTSCSWPAAVTAGVHPQFTTYYQVSALLSKLLMCDAESSRFAIAAGGMHTLLIGTYAGVNKAGRPYAGTTADIMAGALGAFSFRDGVSSGGVYWVPMNKAGDVETWEQALPVLCLYRREVPNGGGHGRWRGGAALTSAYTGHNTGKVQRVNSNTAASSVSSGLGLSGGYPGSGGGCYAGLDTGLRKQMSEGVLPGNAQELHAAVAMKLAPAFANSRVQAGDVWEVLCPSGAGFGDPLLRNAERLQHDLDEGLAPKIAARIYGVVLDAEGGIDTSATELRRAEMFEQRLAAAKPFESGKALPRDVKAQVLHPVADQIEHVRSGGAPMFRCRHCAQLLARSDENYKVRVPYLEMTLPEIDPQLFLDPRDQVDGQVVLRQYLCPGCGVLLDADICRPEDSPVWDMRLAG